MVQNYKVINSNPRSIRSCNIYRLRDKCYRRPDHAFPSQEHYFVECSQVTDHFDKIISITKVGYFAPSYSSLYSKLCLVSSALGHHGSCCMLMT